MSRAGHGQEQKKRALRKVARRKQASFLCKKHMIRIARWNKKWQPGFWVIEGSPSSAHVVLQDLMQGAVGAGGIKVWVYGTKQPKRFVHNAMRAAQQNMLLIALVPTAHVLPPDLRACVDLVHVSSAYHPDKTWKAWCMHMESEVKREAFPAVCAGVLVPNHFLVIDRCKKHLYFGKLDA